MTPTLRAARRLAVSPRAAARLAWGLCALTWLLVLAAVILALLSGAEARPEKLDSLLSDVVAFDLLAATFTTVGAMVAARDHRNPVAWILCVTGLGYALAVFATEYALYALLAEPGALPGGEAQATARSAPTTVNATARLPGYGITVTWPTGGLVGDDVLSS